MVSGVKFTSKINGKSIFLPIEDDFSEEIKDHYSLEYWSRTAYDENDDGDDDEACYLSLHSDDYYLIYDDVKEEKRVRPVSR